MEGSEQVLDIIESLQSDDFRDYNLILTTRRIVLIRTRSLRFPELGLVKGGWWGWAPDSSTLDHLLQNDENNYAINYAEIDAIKLHKGVLRSKLVVESRGSQKIFFFDKNFEKIYTMLLQTPALEGKVSISK
ncbi:MAG: hypothetical protein ABSA79_09010 [Candidatus Bathyarchaeia archaeon]